MIKEIRKKFNADFSQPNYEKFLKFLDSVLKYPTDFRVAETPIFLSKELTNKLEHACADILHQITTDEFKSLSQNAIPKEFKLSGETDHPNFLQIDFAIAKDENGNLIPKLIELQGFPSLYCYQVFLNREIRKFFNIDKVFSCYFSGMNEKDYIELFKKIILEESNPENVILLEINPEKQKTRIDFAATEKLTGIKSVSITDLIKEGKNLFYKHKNKKIKIDRIYNRVIFDELIRKNIKLNFNIKDEINVTWVGHPNWFFKISKYSLPFLKGKYTSRCFFLNELEEYPDDLNNYVLKPLYSFAGHGVEIEVTKELLDKIEDKRNYILQEKIEYAELIETPEGNSKVEIRMMFLWKDKPILSNNLVRMSKGKMMGVDYNKNKSWVGSSLAYHL
jgi:hypothetical protein